MATISSSNLMVALVQAATTLPPFLFSVFAGAIVDNFSRRKVMLIARCLMAVASATLTAVVALGFINPWVILGFSFLAGCGTAFNDPAWQASVGDIVSRRDLPAAVTLTSVGFNTVRSVGPALGGIILASFGPLAAFATYTVCVLAPLIAIWRCQWQVRASSLPRESLLTAVSDGIRFTLMSVGIKSAIARGILFGLAGISILALLPVVVRDHLQGSAVAYGSMMAGFGAGALIAGLLSSRLRSHLSDERLLKYACLACATCAISLAFTSSISVAALALMLGGAGWVLGWSGLSVSVQWASPRWIVGRTISIYYAMTYGGLAAGSWLWGAIAEEHSLAIALTASAAAIVAVAAIGFVMPIHDRVDVDLTPHEGFQVPSLALDLQLRSGPIVSKTEYVIAEEDVAAFLDLMRQHRQIQSRIGAREWKLLRSLQDPRRWTESFRTPTWADYLRLNHRLTNPDMQVSSRICGLHIGSSAPRTELSIERPTALSRKNAAVRPLLPQA